MATAQTDQQFFPNLLDLVPYHTATEIKQLRQYIYNLFDSKAKTVDYFLSAPKRIDADLVAGKSYFFIVRQDAVGGWGVDWATNPDGSLKFKGIATVPPVTTASTYSAFHFIATGPTEALLVSITGGNLS